MLHIEIVASLITKPGLRMSCRWRYIAAMKHQLHRFTANINFECKGSIPDRAVLVSDGHDVFDFCDALSDERGEVLDEDADVRTFLQLQPLA